VIEVRWHARAGQGAKSAAAMLATALLEAGESVQAFPEYGPERRGAPMRAYTRADDRPIRRHDSVVEPDVVVVLEPSLLAGGNVTGGLRPRGLLLVNTDRPAQEVRSATGWHGELVCVPGTRLAAARGLRFANVVLLGALAAAIGRPPLEGLLDSVGRLLARKGEEAVAAARAAVTDGYLHVAVEEVAWAS
jgi:2-oxoacid:acceptor oxidoreductase gamma subunit (pyruvate/2-ketoisovalerate family)